MFIPAFPHHLPLLNGRALSCLVLALAATIFKTFFLKTFPLDTPDVFLAKPFATEITKRLDMKSEGTPSPAGVGLGRAWREIREGQNNERKLSL